MDEEFDHGFRMGDYDWRNEAGDEQVLLPDGLIAYEKEVYLAVEKLTPFLQEKEDRFPNEHDITTFVMIIRGM
jgi:hypothetical protein